MTASGAVSDYDVSVQAKLVSNMAATLDVAVAAVSLSVTAASVHLVFSVSVADISEAAAVTNKVKASLSSASHASATLGVPVVSAPVTITSDRSISPPPPSVPVLPSPPPTPNATMDEVEDNVESSVSLIGGAVGGAATAVLLVLLVGIHVYWRKKVNERRPTATSASAGQAPRVPVNRHGLSSKLGNSKSSSETKVDLRSTLQVSHYI